MGDTIIIARVPTITIIACILDNGDRNSIAIAIVGDSVDANINARDRDIEDRDSVAIVIVGNPHGRANDHDIHDITGPQADDIHDITGPRADVVATDDLAIDTQTRIDTRTRTRANGVDIDDHNRGRPTPSAPSPPLPN
jgi:hypothetical protein